MRLYERLDHAVGWVIDRPWLAAVALVVVFGVVAARNLIAARRHRYHAANARLITIAPPPDVDAKGARALWSNLGGALAPSWWRRVVFGAPHVVWQYAWAGRQLTISIWVPGTIPPGAVETFVRSAWPSASCTIHDEPAGPIPTGPAAAGRHLLPHAPEWLPFATGQDIDPLRPVLAAGSQLHDSEYAAVQILARPARPSRVRRARRAAERLRAGKPATAQFNPAKPLVWIMDLFVSNKTHTTPVPRPLPDLFAQRDVKGIAEKVSGIPLWETAVRYAVAADPRLTKGKARGRLRGLGDTIASAFAIYSARNGLTRRTRMHAPAVTLTTRRLGTGFLTSTPELAALAGLPQDVAVAGLTRARAKSAPAPIAVTGGGRRKMLGTTEVDGRAVGLTAADARYHVHMVGTTGSGKTTLLANMILDDINAGRGTVVIDPHGDLALDILDRLPLHVADRVVLFDPLQNRTDRDHPDGILHPPTLNPLELRDGADKDLIVDNLVSICGAIFAKGWGPRMDDVMRVACLTLLKKPDVSLQLIPPLLNNSQLRAEITADLHDSSGLGGFWAWYDSMPSALRSQVIGPVLARLRAFLLRDFVRKTMSYPKSSFNMADILNGGILIVRIPKGTLGEDTSRLLGSLILAQVWQAATARAAIKPEQRKDCSVYLDEAHNFLTLATGIGEMLAEARKYRLSMVLAHQDLAQFPKDLLSAVSANARNKIYFTVAPEDAKTLGVHVEPELDVHDLAHLDAYTAIARLVVDGRQEPAFTIKTSPPKPLQGHGEAIRRVASDRVPQQNKGTWELRAEHLAAASTAEQERKERHNGPGEPSHGRPWEPAR
ncbi:type IV secretion system DNA-binding domain-containing protein [Longispora sp. NPDC051575]|uniref:type IV secretory system conjugative DNA transfer family protein n=1 Tax=Longispora sp. NPDC051575 TaxID=3154943 RepID=UPI00343F7841